MQLEEMPQGSFALSSAFLAACKIIYQSSTGLSSLSLDYEVLCVYVCVTGAIVWRFCHCVCKSVCVVVVIAVVVVVVVKYDIQCVPISRCYRLWKLCPGEIFLDHGDREGS